MTTEDGKPRSRGGASPMSGRLSLRFAAALVGLVALALPAGGSRGARAGDDNTTLGARVYERCAACHSLHRNRTGPKHCGLIGRTAGALPGFDYSAALAASTLVWSAATLDRFLADPLGSMPGTTMGYDGVKDQEERAALIAYLVKVNRPGGTCD